MNYYILFSLGIIATILSQIYRIPQIYQLYKTKSGNDISKWSIFIQSSSYIFYIIYSIFNWDIVYIASNSVSLFENIIIYIMIKQYK